MKKQKMLYVKWSESEEATFYIDKDVYSRAHDNGNIITLKSFGGVYTFDKQTKTVTLNTGTENKAITVSGWKFYETPTPA